MDDAAARQNVARYRLTPKIAGAQIKELARDSKHLKWSRHALARMDEREIFDADVIRILRNGMIYGEPEENKSGEWKCKITLRLRGTREAAVVLIILKKAGGLLIKTVEWEDLR